MTCSRACGGAVVGMLILCTGRASPQPPPAEAPEAPAKTPTTAEAAKTTAKTDASAVTFDGFDGKLRLNWKIQNPDPNHYSLTRNPGTLTITTQQGSISKGDSDYENLFLIKCPAKASKDCQVTTCLKSFEPMAEYNQAGLIFYHDDDTYLKWVLVWKAGAIFLTVGCERNGRFVTQSNLPDRQGGTVWLRVTKRGNRYTLSSSVDGKSYRDHREIAWGNRAVRRIGLLGKNGKGRKFPQIDASFDFFEVRLPPPLAAEAAAKPFIPKRHLVMSADMKPCAANLRRIHAAIEKYRKDKGELPKWLTDLLPTYLNAELLLCPNDLKYVGYNYEFTPNPVPRDWDGGARTPQHDWKARQVKRFGDVVPYVRCNRHGAYIRLNVGVGGQIYWSGVEWERLFMPCYRFSDDSSAQKPATRPASEGS